MSTKNALLNLFALALSFGATLSLPSQVQVEVPKAPAGAPNIVLILLDDVGFAETSTFGGLIDTPQLDRLAAHGLRYNNFNTTGMCSPTRAALLTGRNHHHVGYGRITELADPGLPGYDAVLRKDSATIAAVLRENGYSTSAFGKWHNTPYREIGPMGPFDRWPTGLGFEYFFGFMNGCSSQWETYDLYRNTTAIEPKAKDGAPFHFTTAITDDAINWINTQEHLAKGKPYFIYFATGATHWPHHAPVEWIEKFRGRFDQGWDKLRDEIFTRQRRLGVIPASAELTPRPPEIPAWDALSADARRLLARQMEVYAGFLAHTDYEIGRLLQAVRARPDGDNTLVIFAVGDNGSSGEAGPLGTTHKGTDSTIASELQYLDELGGPLHNNNYSAGWAWAGATPFRGMKGIASHLGGIRDPLVISWPAKIKQGGGLCSGFAHVTDIAPTIYASAGVSLPASVDGVNQIPLDGVSLTGSFISAEALERSRVQYFEMVGNRAIYASGWFASARHSKFLHSWYAMNDDVSDDRWELYDLTEDFSQNRDVAEQYPEKLKELKRLFEAEATRNNVFPLGVDFQKLVAMNPFVDASERHFSYSSHLPRIPIHMGPKLARMSYTITAEVTIPTEGSNGTILSYGGRWGGLAWYIQDDHLILETNIAGKYESLRAATPLAPGKAVLGCEFLRDNATGNRTASTATGRLYVNGRVVAEAKMRSNDPVNIGYLGIGQAFGTPVTPRVKPPFRFNGTLEKVTVELKP